MTDTIPTPEDRPAAMATAIVAADRAIDGLAAAVRLLEGNLPTTALALAMVQADIAHALDALRRCRDLLSGDAA